MNKTLRTHSEFFAQMNLRKKRKLSSRRLVSLQVIFYNINRMREMDPFFTVELSIGAFSCEQHAEPRWRNLALSIYSGDVALWHHFCDEDKKLVYVKCHLSVNQYIEISE